MAERERFNMVLSPGQKADWEQYASENPDVDSLSHLVRLAVQKEIAGSDSAGDGGNGEVTEKLSELVEESRQTNNRLESLEARIGTIEQTVQQDPEIRKLANEVFAALPTVKQFEDDSLPDTIPEEHGGPVANSGRVADIAAVLDTSELQAQQALDSLQEDTARIRETESHDGEPLYYKEA